MNYAKLRDVPEDIPCSLEKLHNFSSPYISNTPLRLFAFAPRSYHPSPARLRTLMAYGFIWLMAYVLRLMATYALCLVPYGFFCLMTYSLWLLMSYALWLKAYYGLQLMATYALCLTAYSLLWLTASYVICPLFVLFQRPAHRTTAQPPIGKPAQVVPINIRISV